MPPKTKKEKPAEVPVEEAPAEDEEEPDPNRPAWADWVEKNSKPHVRVIVRPKRELTPWQKRGPMKKKDWMRFYAWAEKNAVVIEPKLKPVEIPCEEGLPCSRTPQQMDPEDLAEKIEKLAIPLERKTRKKYEPPDSDSEYTFSPVIVVGQPPHRDKGRPVKAPEIPTSFPNEDARDDFYRNYRFPISKAALNARPSARILSLSKPRVMPPFPPHCPIPEPVEEEDPLDPEDYKMPRRKKFTKRQWKAHQLRLIHLARPVERPDPNERY